MFSLKKKTAMPAPEDAPPGRDTPRRTGRPTQGDTPTNQKLSQQAHGHRRVPRDQIHRRGTPLLQYFSWERCDGF